ncbi:hypothetical protein [endosymbiont GvMRE of Glomus versiforme]|uniref:hypothetical protein n=1 Tax=endosymbiont GvMRE of Glomus versiforme TaxID=2039283 RepID=UPI0011C49BC9|nr:hypothetical protein [endosymbiont GvMRE of Glomus versiforme]
MRGEKVESNNQPIIFQAQIKQVETKKAINGNSYQTLTLSNGRNTWKVNNFAKYNVEFTDIIDENYWFAVRNGKLASFSYRRQEVKF